MRLLSCDFDVVTYILHSKMIFRYQRFFKYITYGVIMPLLNLKLSIKTSEDANRKLLGNLSQILAEETKKPVQYAMVIVEHAEMALGRDISPSAFADVRGIGGLTKEVNEALSRRICTLLEQELGIAPSRTYITFTDVPAQNWGNDGSLFG
jgi:phenylpyruvate tautomerase PptA (4-oxalocrotonate tautomerase family)